MNNMNNVVTTQPTTFALGKRRKRSIELNEDDRFGVNNPLADIRNDYLAENENNDYDYDYEENTDNDNDDSDDNENNDGENENDNVKNDHHWYYSNYQNNSVIYNLIDSIEIDNPNENRKTIADFDNNKNVNDKKVIKIFNELNNENEERKQTSSSPVMHN